jgi:hypothetical protein
MASENSSGYYVKISLQAQPRSKLEDNTAISVCVEDSSATWGTANASLTYLCFSFCMSSSKMSMPTHHLLSIAIFMCRRLITNNLRIHHISSFLLKVKDCWSWTYSYQLVTWYIVCKKLSQTRPADPHPRCICFYIIFAASPTQNSLGCLVSPHRPHQQPFANKKHRSINLKGAIVYIYIDR